MINNELDQVYWSTRYKENQTGWDVGFCSTPLQVYFDQLTDKTMNILIPGAGYGHEAVYLHKLGFKNIHVVDITQEPLLHILDKCPDFPKDHLICEDFFHHQGQYDLIVEQTFFCAISPKLRAAYVQKVRELLKSNGKLVGVLFNRNFEGGPPYGGNVEDYKSLFSSVFNEVNMESCYNSIEPRKDSEVFIKIS